jgi:hypothetical protein
LADKIAAGLAIEHEAAAAIARAHALAVALPAEQQGELKIPEAPAASLGDGYGMTGFANTVMLPSIEGARGWTSAAPHWPR